MALIRMVRTLWGNGYLLGQLARRAFAARHAGSLFGWWWSLLATGVQFAILWVVFSRILGIRVAEPAGVGFGAYLMTGLVPYLALSDAVQRAAGLFRANAPLVQRVRFPVEVLVVGETVGVLLHQGLALALVGILCAALGVVAPAALAWTAAGVALAVLWSVGLALLVSVGGAFLPDLGEALGLALQVVFYGAPIVYPMAMVPSAGLRAAVAANPVTGIVRAVRAGLTGAPPPPFAALAALAGGGLVLLWLGAAALDRWRLRIPDVV